MSGLRSGDRLLVERSQLGDRNAFDQLFHRHRERAYQYAFRLTRDPDEAGDIVAETLMRMHRAIPKFEGSSSFTTWMYRIAMNCYLDQKRRRRHGLFVSLDAAIQLADAEITRQFEDKGPSPFELATRSEQASALRAAIDLLPEAQRGILGMHHNDMRTYAEMSALLGLPIGTVKSRLNRARRHLSHILNELSPNMVGACHLERSVA